LENAEEARLRSGSSARQIVPQDNIAL